jgi:hypothetical protein
VQEVEKVGRTVRREQRSKTNEKLTMISQKARRMESPNFQSSKPPLCVALGKLQIFAAAVVDEETIKMPARCRGRNSSLRATQVGFKKSFLSL